MTGYDPDLCWRVERACAAAWPAVRRETVGAWSLALSGGGTRRINSASAVHPAATLDGVTLRAIEDRYAAAAQPAILRLTDLTDAATPLLDAADYAPAEGNVRTLYRPMSQGGGAPAGVTCDERPAPAWLAARRQLSVACGAGAEDHAGPAVRVALRACFARIGADDAPTSVGFVVLHEGMAVIEAIATAPGQRRRGHAATLIGTLLAWAARADAAGVALQVEEANPAARALYRRLGFVTDLYGYHYRRRTA